MHHQRTLVAALALAATIVASVRAERSLGVPARAEGLPEVREARDRVSGERALALVDALAAFGTRHTLSDQASDTRGIGAAQRFLKKTLEEAGPRVKARLEEFDAPKMPRLPQGARIANVIAELPGVMPEASRRVVYVVAHFDSINADMMDARGDAPGANDNASGTAVVVECARALAPMQLDAAVVFLCTSAEEQGLVGARMHAESLAARRAYDEVLVFNNDIVGDATPEFRAASGQANIKADSVVRVFSEGLPRNPSAEQLAEIRRNGSESDSASRQLARFVAYVAKRENTAVRPMMIFRQDRFLRGGDHAAFNDAGFPAVRFTAPAEDYSRQHANVGVDAQGNPTGDLPKFVQGDYLGEVAKLNASAIIYAANAPTPPRRARLVAKQLDTGTLVRWDASPEPDVAGYEVVWRATTSPDWEQVQDVGKTTQARLEVSKDNVFFGVRAYDARGYTSPVRFCVAATE